MDVQIPLFKSAALLRQNEKRMWSEGKGTADYLLPQGDWLTKSELELLVHSVSSHAQVDSLEKTYFFLFPLNGNLIFRRIGFLLALPHNIEPVKAPKLTSASESSQAHFSQ